MDDHDANTNVVDPPAHRALSAAHADLLRRSSISDLVAVQRGYRTVADPEELLDLGYADWQAALVPGLLVPMWDVFAENSGSQFRPDSPRLRESKPVKYETPQGQHNLLDVHRLMQPYLGSPDTTLFVTEGVRKADAITSLGYVAIALSGVWNWRGRNLYGGLTALGDWEKIALNGRDVRIVFDSDARTNPQVQKALRRLREFLRAKGAKVTIHLPPCGPTGDKQGVDDYLALGGDWAALLADPFALDAEAVLPRGRLASELRAEVPEQVPWLVPGVLAPGWTTKVAAREKTGKGKLAAYLIGNLERGQPTVFGGTLPTATVTALVLTEEPDESMREKLEDHDVTLARIISGYELAGLDWHQKWRHLLAVAVEEGRELIFVDNIQRATGVEDESGVELATAVSPFADACRDAGIALLIDHHHKKGHDSAENMSRGGTALAGACDINIEMFKAGKGWTSRARNLMARGRVRTSNWTLTITLTDDERDYTIDHFGTTDHEHAHLQPEPENPDAALLAQHPDGITVEQFAAIIGRAKSTAGNRLNTLVKQGLATVETTDNPDGRGGSKINVYRLDSSTSIPSQARSDEESNQGDETPHQDSNTTPHPDSSNQLPSLENEESRSQTTTAMHVPDNF
jgi:hypothetical protein